MAPSPCTDIQRISGSDLIAQHKAKATGNRPIKTAAGPTLSGSPAATGRLQGSLGGGGGAGPSQGSCSELILLRLERKEAGSLVRRHKLHGSAREGPHRVQGGCPACVLEKVGSVGPASWGRCDSRWAFSQVSALQNHELCWAGKRYLPCDGHYIRVST